jgi:hypothetical protein
MIAYGVRNNRHNRGKEIPESGLAAVYGAGFQGEPSGPAFARLASLRKQQPENMPVLSFQIRAVWVRPFAVVPTLVFEIYIHNSIEGEEVHAVTLRCQIHIESSRRLYWMTVVVPEGPFTGETVVEAPVPCYEDHIHAAGKYFDKEGRVPLAFLFSGTLFYSDPGGVMLVHPLSLEEEGSFMYDKLRWLASNRAYPTMDTCLEELVDKAVENTPIN